MGNSTFGFDDRELPAGARQRRRCLELAPERLSKIFRRGVLHQLGRRVDTDGTLPLQREGYKSWSPYP